LVCEAVNTNGDRDTTKKRLKVRNIRFLGNNQEINDKRSDLTQFANTVSITFEFQNNENKMVTVSQPRSGKALCPVTIWTKIVKQVLTYKKCSENTSINVVRIAGKNHYIKATETFTHISHTVNNMEGLGFKGKHVGNHSICSSLAIALYLAKRPVSTIMLSDRWCSDAFILYIRRQVQEFSSGVSADNVILHNTRFRGT